MSVIAFFSDSFLPVVVDHSLFVCVYGATFGLFWLRIELGLVLSFLNTLCCVFNWNFLNWKFFEDDFRSLFLGRLLHAINLFDDHRELFVAVGELFVAAVLKSVDFLEYLVLD